MSKVHEDSVDNLGKSRILNRILSRMVRNKPELERDSTTLSELWISPRATPNFSSFVKSFSAFLVFDELKSIVENINTSAVEINSPFSSSSSKSATTTIVMPDLEKAMVIPIGDNKKHTNRPDILLEYEESKSDIERIFPYLNNVDQDAINNTDATHDTYSNIISLGIASDSVKIKDVKYTEHVISLLEYFILWTSKEDREKFLNTIGVLGVDGGYKEVLLSLSPDHDTYSSLTIDINTQGNTHLFLADLLRTNSIEDIANKKCKFKAPLTPDNIEVIVELAKDIECMTSDRVEGTNEDIIRLDRIDRELLDPYANNKYVQKLLNLGVELKKFLEESYIKIIQVKSVDIRLDAGLPDYRVLFSPSISVDGKMPLRDIPSITTYPRIDLSIAIQDDLPTSMKKNLLKTQNCFKILGKHSDDISISYKNDQSRRNSTNYNIISGLRTIKDKIDLKFSADPTSLTMLARMVTNNHSKDGKYISKLILNESGDDLNKTCNVFLPKHNKALMEVSGTEDYILDFTNTAGPSSSTKIGICTDVVNALANGVSTNTIGDLLNKNGNIIAELKKIVTQSQYSDIDYSETNKIYQSLKDQIDSHVANIKQTRGNMSLLLETSSNVNQIKSGLVSSWIDLYDEDKHIADSKVNKLITTDKIKIIHFGSSEGRATSKFRENYTQIMIGTYYTNKLKSYEISNWAGINCILARTLFSDDFYRSNYSNSQVSITRHSEAVSEFVQNFGRGSSRKGDSNTKSESKLVLISDYDESKKFYEAIISSLETTPPKSYIIQDYFYYED